MDNLRSGIRAKLYLIVSITLLTTISRITETDCFNGIDDDGDGLIDAVDIEDC